MKNARLFPASLVALALLAGLPARGAASAPLCRASVLGEEAQRIFEELAEFQLTLSGLPESSDKMLRLATFRTKFNELKTVWGETLASDLKTYVTEKSAIHQAETAKAVRAKSKAEQSQKVEIERTRYKEVTSFRSLWDTSDFTILDGTFLLTHGSTELVKINYRKREPDLVFPQPREAMKAIAAVTPDKKSAVLAGNESLWLVDLSTNANKSVPLEFKVEQYAKLVQISPDSRFALVMGRKGGIRAVDLVKMERVASTQLDDSHYGSVLAFSPDSRYAFASNGQLGTVLIDLTTGQNSPLPKLDMSIRAIQGAVFTPDSKSLILLGHAGQLIELDLTKKTYEPSKSDPRGHAFALSNDGTKLISVRVPYAGTPDARAPIVVLDRATGKEIGTIKKLDINVGEIVARSAARPVIVVAENHFVDGNQGRAYVVNYELMTATPIPGTPGTQAKYDFSPDGTSLFILKKEMSSTDRELIEIR